MNDQIITKQIKLLDFNERKIMKAIRLNKSLGNINAWADLIYIRDITQEYNTRYEKVNVPGDLFHYSEPILPNDSFDNMVLNAVRTKYPDAIMTAMDINTDSCVERLKIMYAGFKEEQSIIYLTPDFGKIDLSTMPKGMVFNQFRVTLDIFVPIDAFLPYFRNEGYFDYYNLNETDNLENMLGNTLLTVRHLKDML